MSGAVHYYYCLAHNGYEAETMISDDLEGERYFLIDIELMG